MPLILNGSVKEHGNVRPFPVKVKGRFTSGCDENPAGGDGAFRVGGHGRCEAGEIFMVVASASYAHLANKAGAREAVSPPLCAFTIGVILQDMPSIWFTCWPRGSLLTICCSFFPLE